MSMIRLPETTRLTEKTRSALRRVVLRTDVYVGVEGTAWFAGSEQRAPSIAAFFCGSDVHRRKGGIVLRNRIPDRVAQVASAGGLPVVRLHEADDQLDDVLQNAIEVPALVDIHVDLPAEADDLRTQLVTSTTKEDFRRIRKAGFTYRITSDPGAIREFHERHYVPNVAKRFPDDGTIWSLDRMLGQLDDGGELICADIDSEWVAGIYNVRDGPTYTLRSLGIRDADDAIRHKRVVAALIVRSLERAVELQSKRATLGRSLPFLGKGPVWFKAKWGGVLTLGELARNLHMFVDLRQPAVRRMLAASPIIHVADNELVVSAWLEAGDDPLRATVREAGRFPGITRWHVLGEPETLEAGGEQLATRERIVPVPITLDGDEPLWLSRVLLEPAS